jgi:hypothetical protein
MRSWILCGNRKIDHPAICAERFDTAPFVPYLQVLRLCGPVQEERGGRGVNEDEGILLILILLIHNRTEDYYLGKETGEYPEMIQPYLRVFVI